MYLEWNGIVRRNHVCKWVVRRIGKRRERSKSEDPGERFESRSPLLLHWQLVGSQMDRKGIWVGA